MTEYLAPFDELAGNAAGLVGIDFSSDGDGVVLKVSLLFSCAGGYLPSMILVSVAHYPRNKEKMLAGVAVPG